MTLIERLQSYLRHAAQQQYEAVRVPPFTLFFHASNPFMYFNYAIPDEAAAGDLQGPLSELRAAFGSRGRQPRFEYIEEYAPDLGPALRAAGFVEDSRLHLMVCTPDTIRAAPEPPGLTVTVLAAPGTLADARDFLITQRLGFNPDDQGQPADAEVEQFRAGWTIGHDFLGRIDGEAAGVATFMPPWNGVTEVAGIATRESYRRRGVASALTERATRAAFEQDVEIACLTAGDERAGRVYERVGFRPYATTLFYLDPDTTHTSQQAE